MTTSADDPGNNDRIPPKWLRLLMELRAPFFTASIAPVLLGTAMAYNRNGTWSWPLFAWTLLGLVLLHAGSNVINDYFDHRSGNDAANREFVRPFTGGSRMIQRGWLTPREVLILALVCFALGSAIGLYLTWKAGGFILLLGILGVGGGFLYVAPGVNLVARGTGEVFVGLNFGVLPAIGAYYVQTHQHSLDVMLLSLPIAVLITAVLFINEFQDYNADSKVGKRNWVVRRGRAGSVAVYSFMMTIWTLPILAAILFRSYSWLLLLGLLPLIPALKAIATARKHFDHPAELTPANALTVITHLAVGLLLPVMLLLSHRQLL